jgi:hypothetical protein
VLAKKFSSDSIPASYARAQSEPKPICFVVDRWDMTYNGTVVPSRRFVDALRQRGHGFRIL